MQLQMVAACTNHDSDIVTSAANGACSHLPWCKDLLDAPITNFPFLVGKRMGRPALLHGFWEMGRFMLQELLDAPG